MKAKIKWNFPYGKHLTPTGSNHASIETFRDNVLESLTREVLQNSLDAHDYDKKEPVHVSFNQITIKNTDIPDLNHLTDYAVPQANEYWEQNRDTLRYLDKFEKTIKSPEINVLKISDYNTTGLLQENFKSLVHADKLPIKIQWTNKPESSDYSDQWMTKQCFWLNSDYIKEQVKELLD